MTISIEYEAERKLDLPYEEIIHDMVLAALDYEECPYEAEVNVILTDNESIRAINREYREIDSPTDVLSFPMVDYVTPSDAGGYRGFRGQGGGAGAQVWPFRTA